MRSGSGEGMDGMAARSPRDRVPLRLAAGLGLLGVVAAGCSAPYLIRERPTISRASDTFWVPAGPEKALRAALPTPEIPDELRNKRWGLADVLDVALRNNPSTKAAWADARAAAAGYEIQRAAYLPRVDVSATGSFASTHDTRYGGAWQQATWGPRADLTWLLLDFGGRSSSVEGARQVLLSANWTQNAVLQDTVLAVEGAYFVYMASRAILEARMATLRDAERQLDAANHRHEAGVATLADVLQSQTAAAQAKLAVQTAQGAIQTTRGALAASMGVPANLPFDLADLPPDVPVEAATSSVDDLIAEALVRQPSLAAARAAALAARARVRKAESDGLPTLGLNAATGSTRFNAGGDKAATAVDHREDYYSAGLFLRFPLFTGFAQTATVEQARALADAAAERVKGLEQQIMSQVFSSYYGLKTATEKIKTARALLSSASQSEHVARGRYTEGVGTILEVLTAQSALADARAQNVQAQFEWYTTLAQLARNTGLLGLHGETPLAPPRSDPAAPAR